VETRQHSQALFIYAYLFLVVNQLYRVRMVSEASMYLKLPGGFHHRSFTGKNVTGCCLQRLHKVLHKILAILKNR